MTEAELVRERVLQDVGRLSTTPMYADTTLCPDVYAVIEPLLSEVERLRGVVKAAREVVRATQWKQYATKKWCDTEIGPMGKLVKALAALEEEE